MLFALGVITGLLVAILLVAALIYFKKPVEAKLATLAKQVENAGPRPKGILIDAPSMEEEAREEIIEKNQADGKDTPISELQS